MGSVDGLDARFRRLMAGLGGVPAELDEGYAPRFAYFQSIFRRSYGSLSPREQDEAAHRLASGRPAVADRARVMAAWERGDLTDLGPPPSPHPDAVSRARARVERFEQWRRREEGVGR